MAEVKGRYDRGILMAVEETNKDKAQDNNDVSFKRLIRGGIAGRDTPDFAGT